MTEAPTSASQYESILFDRADAVATITFNRPEKRNAFTVGFFEEFHDALDLVEADDTVRVLVLAANGPAFSAGRDFNESTKADSKAGTRYGELNLGARDRLRRMAKPVIARVQGPAAGGGCAFATESSDITVASKKARFSIREVQAGTLPGLPLFTLGRARTLGMLLTGDWIDAEKAEQWGLIYKAVPEEELDATVAEIAGKLAAQPADAMAYTKRATCFLLDLAGHARVEEYLAECRKILHLSDERLDAQNSFLERRRR